MIIDPINGESVSGGEVLINDDGPLVSFVNRRLVDLLFVDVTPEYHSSPEYEIEGCRHFGVVDDSRHLLTIECNFSNVVTSGEKKTRVTFRRFTSGQVFRVSKVSRCATAFEGSLLVQTELRAATGFKTLVDVVAGAIVRQTVAGTTSATVTDGKVDADLRATSVVLLALVDSAELLTLVLPT